MTQKLGIAACLLSGKELYVLDEPAGALIPRRALFKNELRSLRASGQHGVLHLPLARRRRRAVRPHGSAARRRLRYAGTPARAHAAVTAAGPGERLPRLHRGPGAAIASSVKTLCEHYGRLRVERCAPGQERADARAMIREASIVTGISRDHRGHE